ncbi:MAG TPA: thiolase domain-containing protein [Acidimicrobiales bacterium]|nr:thiolase domain-containing protein [Acidimicrobiales bacterium]
MSAAANADRSVRRPVSIASFAQSDNVRRENERNEVEMLQPVVAEVFANIGIDKDDIHFICSGSTDYLIGGPFSFVTALDAVGVWPPRAESHVEMDGAWALYEAWVLLQEGEIDTALVYSFGRSSPGNLQEILALQLDPYYLAPLWPDPVSLAALQARALLDAGKATEEDFAAIASRSRKDALGNPKAQVSNDISTEALMKDDYVVSPLRRHALPPITDGAAAIVLAAGDKAREWSDNPVWITGFDHRIETHSLGARDLTSSPSTAKAGEVAGVADGAVDVAELHAPYAHQEIILKEALGLGDGVRINPSGGALAANPMMSAGLIRIGEAAARIAAGEAGRAVAHATSGPCLQQNLVCVLEGGE